MQRKRCYRRRRRRRRIRRCHNNKTHPFLSVFALPGKTTGQRRAAASICLPQLLTSYLSSIAFLKQSSLVVSFHFSQLIFERQNLLLTSASFLFSTTNLTIRRRLLHLSCVSSLALFCRAPNLIRRRMREKTTPFATFPRKRLSLAVVIFKELILLRNLSGS